MGQMRFKIDQRLEARVTCGLWVSLWWGDELIVAGEVRTAGIDDETIEDLLQNGFWWRCVAFPSDEGDETTPEPLPSP